MLKEDMQNSGKKEIMDYYGGIGVYTTKHSMKSILIDIKMNKILISLISFLIIGTAIGVLVYFVIIGNMNSKYSDINKGDDRGTVNAVAMPLIENNAKYIELQTKKWIKDREENNKCYALLEKDKIIMMKWMEEMDIRRPQVHYYDYHTNFTLEKLTDIINNNKHKRLVLKLSHLQSNYGIMIIQPNSTESDILKIYQKCQKLFKSCFVCNHDKNDAPNSNQIKKREKESYYKLYETIEPGVLIQDFFYSYGEGIEQEPYEIKVMLLGDKIISLNYDIFQPKNKMQKVYQEAKRVSAYLGASLIRVDFFVKKSDKVYEPYLNEISLSPNGGIKANKFLSKKLINEYKNKLNSYNQVEYDYINKLLDQSPPRSIPIEYYLSDGDSFNEKFKFD